MRKGRSASKKYYEILKEYREDHDLRQEDIAKQLNIAQNSLSQYENHKRNMPIEIFTELLKLYQLSADYVLGLSKDQRTDRWEK
ncbi:MAG: helix-turn-helix transcriptional regulator [Acutalibacteraceae bacterium]|nr:helix-turn-helix transcriptional regulator [Acutalibacteraceae bacterium]